MSAFERGYNPGVQFQDKPGFEHQMNEKPIIDQLPTGDGGYTPYKAAGKLESKKALITGGDSGIGRAIAVLFAMEGADVFIAYLPQEEQDAQDTKAMVEKHGRQCHLLATDLRERKNCTDTVAKAVKALGHINILILNHATQQTIEEIKDLSDDQWLNTFNTNIHPFFYLAKDTLGYMKPGDNIVTNASINHFIGRPDLLDYTSTKGAIVGFTRALSNQVLSKGIRVNAVAPGPVWTPLVPATMGEEQQKNKQAPIGRPSQPSEIATAFVFLASPDGSSVSGQVIHANGGVVIN